MNALTVGIGALACGYAVFVLVMRLAGKDDKFRKLGPMREFWGPRLGSGIHYFGYVLVPLAVGAWLITHGLRGGSLF